MNLEQMFLVFKAASRSDSGATYEVTKKWFLESGIIDGGDVNVMLFENAYKRVSDGKGYLGLSPFIFLIGILARESRQEPIQLYSKFLAVKEFMIEDIQEQFDRNTVPYLP